MKDWHLKFHAKVWFNIFRKLKNHISNYLLQFILKKYISISLRKIMLKYVFNSMRRSYFSKKASIAWKKALSLEKVSLLAQQKPSFSIIMPTKNRPHVILRSIESVLSQSYDKWELIIVDDSSTDGTYEALLNLVSDPRVRIVRSDGNGVSAARNCGIRESKGEVVAYLDDDNCWLEDYLEVTILQMLKTKASCCYSVQRRFSNGLNVLKGVRYLQRPFDLEKLKLFNYIDINVFAHRREICDELGVFDETLRRLVDWDLIIRYCEKYPPTFCNSVGANYDDSKKSDRISLIESVSYLYIVRNKHLINWCNLKKEVNYRNKDLVSIIIVVDNNFETMKSCLDSLFRQNAGLAFEIIMVDNGSTTKTIALMRKWALRDPRIKLLLNQDNMNFPLSNNLGFAVSRGSNVVFLNSSIEVTSEWLRSLIAPLADPKIFGVQPTLVCPDRSVQNVGLVFSDHAPGAYGLYFGLSGNDPLVAPGLRFKALTSSCLAMRAIDFLRVGGFDPHFLNCLSDVDLCLRIGGAEPVFICTSEAVVIQSGKKSAEPGKSRLGDLTFFAERWSGKISCDDLLRFKENFVDTESYIPVDDAREELGLTVSIPQLNFRKASQKNQIDEPLLCEVTEKTGKKFNVS